MKIGIYGAGAIGGYLAVLLANAGHEVTCIARGAHLAAMKERGLKLKIDGEEKVAKIFATDDPREAGPQDYLFVALKAHQAYEAAENFLPLLGPETPVVTAMNGVPWWYFHKLPGRYENHRLQSVDPGGWQWKTLGPERAIGCVVYPATEIAEPGVIVHKYGNKFTLGEPDGSLSERGIRLSEAMEDAGFRAPLRDNIRDDIWIKLWGNLCFNPISALTGATLDIVATDTATRILSRSMMLEAQSIGEALGVHFRVDVHRRINGAAEVGAHKTSMLQDLERGRPMEIDALVTAVQEMGRLADIETPYIDSVLGLIQQRAKVLGLYPTFPGPDSETDEDTRDAMVD
jgi:2-dehydropantoate 2-reductase